MLSAMAMLSAPTVCPPQLSGVRSCVRASEVPADDAAAVRADMARKQMAKAKRALVNDKDGQYGGMKAKPRAAGKRTERKKAASGKGFGARKSGLNYDRSPAGDVACGCGLDADYASCCRPCHDGSSPASTPEMLLRSRFTAYSYRLPDYLMSTTAPEGPEWQSNAAKWKKELLSYTDKFNFLRLRVGDEESTSDEASTISFRAQIVQKGTINLMDLCETSQMVKRDGKWLYLDGTSTMEAPE